MKKLKNQIHITDELGFCYQLSDSYWSICPTKKNTLYNDELCVNNLPLNQFQMLFSLYGTDWRNVVSHLTGAKHVEMKQKTTTQSISEVMSSLGIIRLRHGSNWPWTFKTILVNPLVNHIKFVFCDVKQTVPLPIFYHISN